MAIPIARATNLEFNSDALRVSLLGGKTVEVSLERFPTLYRASAEARADWRLVAGGVGVHWSALDEDVSVAKLIGAA